MPWAYPLARGHPSGSILRLTAQPFPARPRAAFYERALDKGSPPLLSKPRPTSLQSRWSRKGQAPMSVTEPPKDTPFGLEPNVAAGLAYLFTLLGGIIMLVGGGTNKFVKWSAAQSITLWGATFVLYIAFWFIAMVIHPFFFLTMLLSLAYFVVWIWTTVTGFQGKEVRVPVIDGITESIFKSQL
jgi:uncharacterized membrane protein